MAHCLRVTQVCPYRHRKHHCEKVSLPLDRQNAKHTVSSPNEHKNDKKKSFESHPIYCEYFSPCVADFQRYFRLSEEKGNREVKCFMACTSMPYSTTTYESYVWVLYIWEVPERGKALYQHYLSALGNIHVWFIIIFYELRLYVLCFHRWKEQKEKRQMQFHE